MNEHELRELNIWIWINVFGWVPWKEEEFPYRDGFAFGDEFGEKCLECDMPQCSTDPAASMQVLEKCAEKTSILISAHGGGYLIRGTHNDGHSFNEFIDAPTIELSICLFAQKLFSKP